MRSNLDLPAVAKLLIVLPAFAGLVALGIGLYAIVYHLAPEGAGLKVRGIEFSGSEAVLILLVGALLVMFAGLLLFRLFRAQRAAAAALTQTINGKEFEAPKGLPAILGAGRVDQISTGALERD